MDAAALNESVERLGRLLRLPPKERTNLLAAEQHGIKSPNLFLTQQEAANILGIGLRTVQQLTNRGDMKSIHINRNSRRIFIGDLLEFVEQRRTKPKAIEKNRRCDVRGKVACKKCKRF